MKTIVIFGATGGIGAYTALYLKDTGAYNVIAVGHRKSDNGFYAQYDIEYYSVDVSDYSSFDKLPKNNYSLHLFYLYRYPIINT